MFAALHLTLILTTHILILSYPTTTLPQVPVFAALHLTLILTTHILILSYPTTTLPQVPVFAALHRHAAARTICGLHKHHLIRKEQVPSHTL